MRVTDSNRGGVWIADGTNLSMRFDFEVRESNYLRMHKACVVPAPLIIGRTSAVDGPGATIGEDLDHEALKASEPGAVEPQARDSLERQHPKKKTYSGLASGGNLPREPLGGGLFLFRVGPCV